MKNIERWRLILGKQADKENSVALEGESLKMDQTLEALYESDRKGGLGSASPRVNRWLGDIRKYFPRSVVQLMQRDALERLGLEQMLLEPELLSTIEADVHLVGVLLTLSEVIPEATKETARTVVRKVVERLKKQLEHAFKEALKGALDQATKNRRPRYPEIDWPKTIRANLKYYQPEYKALIPKHLIGAGRRAQSLKDVILCVDQSGSMASSVVYASIFGAVMASLPALQTHMVVFDTQVADLTSVLQDPIDVLFGTQLGGGTDIAQAMGYVERLVNRPADTILVLISDLYEGGDRRMFLQRVQAFRQQGVQMVVLLALDDEGTPAYDRELAHQLAALEVPAFACTPDLFPDLMATILKKQSLSDWMGRMRVVARY